MTTSSPDLALTRGLGPSLAAADSRELVGTSLFALDRDFPQLSLSAGAIAHNIAEMMAYVRARGVALAPHGKTAMSPQLAQMQIDAGAWAITAATPAQLRVYRGAGVRRLLLANQLVEPGAAAWLRDELARDPRFECLVYVDSTDGVDLLADDRGGRSLDVLLEVGHAGGRTGARDESALRAVAERAARAPGIRVAGIAAYEGTLGRSSPAESAGRVAEFARSLAEVTLALETDGLVPRDCLVTIGGSAYFDAALDGLTARGIAPGRIVLRSGAYLAHDDGQYARSDPRARGDGGAPSFRPAISVWAPVLSIPEPGLAIALCGRRDVGSDGGLPAIKGVRSRDGSRERPFTGRVTQLADQHAFLEFDPARYAVGDEPRVGDLVELGVSHPCTTLDRWSLVPLVDDDHRVRDLIRLIFG
ncbi:alanine racemase [Microbacterium karelineae]|uniref:alanine racemase n=1 Tax=Microbacterium karelineae TaxID=2654283 RepID=UPI0018D35EF3|nr:alanine racemase [Microbacterium karelineae]